MLFARSGEGIFTFWSQFLEIRTQLKSYNFLFQDSLESKNAACQDFVSQLNESLAVWGGRLPVDARYIRCPLLCMEICLQ